MDFDIFLWYMQGGRDIQGQMYIQVGELQKQWGLFIIPKYDIKVFINGIYAIYINFCAYVICIQFLDLQCIHPGMCKQADDQ